MPNKEKVRQVYDDLSEYYDDLGTPEEFEQYMADDQKRELALKLLNKHYNVKNDFTSFTNALGYGAQPEPAATATGARPDAATGVVPGAPLDQMNQQRRQQMAARMQQQNAQGAQATQQDVTGTKGYKDFMQGYEQYRKDSAKQPEQAVSAPQQVHQPESDEVAPGTGFGVGSEGYDRFAMGQYAGSMMNDVSAQKDQWQQRKTDTSFGEQARKAYQQQKFNEQNAEGLQNAASRIAGQRWGEKVVGVMEDAIESVKAEMQQEWQERKKQEPAGQYDWLTDGMKPRFDEKEVIERTVNSLDENQLNELINENFGKDFSELDEKQQKQAMKMLEEYAWQALGKDYKTESALGYIVGSMATGNLLSRLMQAKSDRKKLDEMAQERYGKSYGELVKEDSKKKEEVAMRMYGKEMDDLTEEEQQIVATRASQQYDLPGDQLASELSSHTAAGMYQQGLQQYAAGLNGWQGAAVKGTAGFATMVADGLPFMVFGGIGGLAGNVAKGMILNSALKGVSGQLARQVITQGVLRSARTQAVNAMISSGLTFGLYDAASAGVQSYASGNLSYGDMLWAGTKGFGKGALLGGMNVGLKMAGNKYVGSMTGKKGVAARAGASALSYGSEVAFFTALEQIEKNGLTYENFDWSSVGEQSVLIGLMKLKGHASDPAKVVEEWKKPIAKDLGTLLTPEDVEKLVELGYGKKGRTLTDWVKSMYELVVDAKTGESRRGDLNGALMDQQVPLDIRRKLLYGYGVVTPTAVAWSVSEPVESTNAAGNKTWTVTSYTENSRPIEIKTFGSKSEAQAWAENVKNGQVKNHVMMLEQMAGARDKQVMNALYQLSQETGCPLRQLIKAFNLVMSGKGTSADKALITEAVNRANSMVENQRRAIVEQARKEAGWDNALEEALNKEPEEWTQEERKRIEDYRETLRRISDDASLDPRVRLVSKVTTEDGQVIRATNSDGNTVYAPKGVVLKENGEIDLETTKNNGLGGAVLVYDEEGNNPRWIKAEELKEWTVTPDASELRQKLMDTYNPTYGAQAGNIVKLRSRVRRADGVTVDTDKEYKVIYAGEDGTVRVEALDGSGEMDTTQAAISHDFLTQQQEASMAVKQERMSKPITEEELRKRNTAPTGFAGEPAAERPAEKAEEKPLAAATEAPAAEAPMPQAAETPLSEGTDEELPSGALAKEGTPVQFYGEEEDPVNGTYVGPSNRRPGYHMILNQKGQLVEVDPQDIVMPKQAETAQAAPEKAATATAPAAAPSAPSQPAAAAPAETAVKPQNGLIVDQNTGMPTLENDVKTVAESYANGTAGMSYEEAKGVVDYMISDKQAQQQKLQQRMPQFKGNMVKYQQEKAAWSQQMEQVKAEGEWWNGVKTEMQRINMEREQLKREEAQRQAAAAEAERQAAIEAQREQNRIETQKREQAQREFMQALEEKRRKQEEQEAQQAAEEPTGDMLAEQAVQEEKQRREKMRIGQRLAEVGQLTDLDQPADEAMAAQVAYLSPDFKVTPESLRLELGSNFGKFGREGMLRLADKNGRTIADIADSIVQAAGYDENGQWRLDANKVREELIKCIQEGSTSAIEALEKRVGIGTERPEDRPEYWTEERKAAYDAAQPEENTQTETVTGNGFTAYGPEGTEDFFAGMGDEAPFHVNEGGTPAIRTNAERESYLASTMGLKVSLLDHDPVEGVDGMIGADGEVMVNMHSSKGAGWLIGHETGHRIQRLAYDRYRAFKEAALGMLSKDELAQRIEAKKKLYREKVSRTLTDSQAGNEIANDMIGEIFNDPAKVEELIKKTTPSVWRTIMNTIEDMWASLTGESKSNARKVYVALRDAMTAAREAELQKKSRTAKDIDEAIAQLNSSEKSEGALPHQNTGTHLLGSIGIRGLDGGTSDAANIGTEILTTKDLLKNLASMTEKISSEEDLTAENYQKRLIEELGLKTYKQKSDRFMYFTPDGRLVSIRLSNHNATSRTNKGGQQEDYSFVIRISPKQDGESFKADKDMLVHEYTYDYPDKQRLVDITKSIFGLIKNGEFEDLAGADGHFESPATAMLLVDPMLTRENYEELRRSIINSNRSVDSKALILSTIDREYNSAQEDLAGIPRTLGEEKEYHVREKEEPKKKGIGYKVFYRNPKDGKLYPPMVANPDGADTPIGVWLDADAAPVSGESKTGRPQVKAGGKGTQGGSGQLAYRPGWHLGEIPYALQFGRLNPETGKKDLFPKDFVWAEVEYAADNDYQQEAEAEGMTENGKFRHSYAGLKRLPEDGFYRYRTNPNPETDPWIITGAMKVNRIMTDDEVDEIVRKAGREPQKREGGQMVRDDVKWTNLSDIVKKQASSSYDEETVKLTPDNYVTAMYDMSVKYTNSIHEALRELNETVLPYNEAGLVNKNLSGVGQWEYTHIGQNDVVGYKERNGNKGTRPAYGRELYRKQWELLENPMQEYKDFYERMAAKADQSWMKEDLLSKARGVEMRMERMKQLAEGVELKNVNPMRQYSIESDENDASIGNNGKKLWNYGEKSVISQSETAYGKYLTPEYRKEAEERARKEGKMALPQLAFISEASKAGVVIPVEEIMAIPEIAEAQAKVDSNINNPLKLSLSEEKSEAKNLLENYNSAVYDPVTGKWSFNGEVKKEKKLFIVIGRPAGGKSSVFANPLSQKHKARIIDSDDAKKTLPGYDNGNGAGIVQNASAHIANIAMKESIKRGENIVMPRIGGSSVIDFAILAKKNGYEVNLYYNDIPLENSIMRSAARFAETGRYLDLKFLQDVGEKPYDTLSKYNDKSLKDAEYERIIEEIRKLEAKQESGEHIDERALSRLRDRSELGRYSGSGLTDYERSNEGKQEEGREGGSLLLGQNDAGGSGPWSGLGRDRRDLEQLSDQKLFDHVEWKNNDVPFKTQPETIWTSEDGVDLPENGGRVDRAKTNQFKSWFGDWEKNPEDASKVVDAEGRPLVLSHGTPYYGFTIFNTRRNNQGEITMGSHFGSRAAAQDRLNDMGTRAETTETGIYDVYLNIRKPWECTDWFDQNDPYIMADLAKLAMANKDNATVQRYWNYIKNWESWSKEYTDEELADAEFLMPNGQKTVDGLDSWASDAMGELYNFVRSMVQAAGYDGIKYWNDIEGKGYSWVVFSPEQIKSAETRGRMANNGRFDGKNPDIRYSVEENRAVAKSVGVDEKLMGAVQQATGVSVRMGRPEEFASRKQNAFFDHSTNEIVINPNGRAADNFTGIMGHEVLHTFEKEEGYDNLQNQLLGLMYGDEKQVSDAMNSIIERYARQNIALTPDQARKEVAADVCKNLLFSGRKGAERFADAMRKANGDMGLAERMYGKMRDWLDRIIEMVKGRPMEGVSIKDLQEARDAYAEMAKQAKKRNDRRMMEDRQLINENGDVMGQVDNAHNLQSSNIATYRDYTDEFGVEHKGTRTCIVEFMQNNGYSQDDIANMTWKMDWWEGYMQNLAKFTNPDGSLRFEAFHEWNIKTPQYKVIGEHTEKVLSSLVNNGEYPVNLELSTDCIKRETFTQVLNEIARMGGSALKNLNPGEITAIQEMMKSHGVQTACPLCFVEGKRLMIRNWGETIANDWNLALNEALGLGIKTKQMKVMENGKPKMVTVFANPEKAVQTMNEKLGAFGFYKEGDEVVGEDPVSVWKAGEALDVTTERQKQAQRINNVFNILSGRKGGLLSKDMRDMDKQARKVEQRMLEMENAWAQKHPGEPWKMTVKERDEIDKMLLAGKKAVYDKMLQAIAQYPELRHTLSLNDMIGNAGLDALRSRGGKEGEAFDKLFSLMLSRFGSGTPKVVQRSEPYAGEIMEKSMDNAVHKADSEGGWRLFSFSDFDVTKTFDIMQIMWDAEARKAKLQSYSKEVPYILMFGRDTNAKINMSTLAQAGTEQQMRQWKKEYQAQKGDAAREAYKKKIQEYVGLQTDEAGNITGFIWSNSHSVSPRFAEEIFHDERYNANCGATTVGVGVNHTLWSCLTPWIRQVIPFHLSGMPLAARERTDVGWYRDATKDQNTNVLINGSWVSIHSKAAKDAKLRDFNFYEGEESPEWDMRQRCRDYVKWCEENGYKPRFQWAVNAEEYAKWCKENGYETNKQIYDSMKDNETDGVFNGYYKVITDFNTYKPVFDKEGNMIGEEKAPHMPIKGNFAMDDETLGMVMSNDGSMLDNRERNISNGNGLIKQMASKAIRYLNGEISEQDMLNPNADAFKNNEDSEVYLNRKNRQYSIEDDGPDDDPTTPGGGGSTPPSGERERNLEEMIEYDAREFEREFNRMKTEQDYIALVSRVREFVRNRMTPLAGRRMTASDINGLMRDVDYAITHKTKKGLERALDRMQMLIHQAEGLAQIEEMMKTLNTRTTTVDKKGMVKGVLVDKTANEVLNNIKESYYTMLSTSYDDRLSEVRREIRALKEEYGITRQDDPSAPEEFRTRLEALKGRLSALKEERDNLRGEQVQETVDTLNNLEMQLTEQINSMTVDENGNAVETTPEQMESMVQLKMALPIRMRLAELRQMMGTKTEIQQQKDHASSPNERQRLEKEMDQMQRRINITSKEITEELKDIIGQGRGRRAEQVKADIEHQQEIVRMGCKAVRDAEVPDTISKKNNETWWKRMSSGAAKIRDMWQSPIWSFNFISKYIDHNNAQGEGDFYNYFMKGENGALKANNEMSKGIRENMQAVDEKVRDIFGKSYEKVKQESGKVTNRKITKLVPNKAVPQEQWAEEGKRMTKGQMLYAWLTWRQEAGRTKMEADGWTRQSMREIEEQLGDEYIAFGRWLTDEHLKQLRDDKYNVTYENVMGTSMHKASNYFPLRIDKLGIADKSEVGQDGTINLLPSSASGNLIVRTTNRMPVDLSNDAFEVLEDYNRTMERWNAMIGLTKDLNTLIKSPAFRNLMEANHEGLFQRWKDACAVATASYHAKGNDVDKFLSTLHNGFMQQAIGYGWYTAIKQTLSAPAFWAYSSDPKYWAYMGVNSTPLTAYHNYRWAKENLPSFQERIAANDMGIEGINDKSWTDYISRKFKQGGMAANKMVDAITVANGARAIYEYDSRRFKKMLNEDGTRKFTDKQAEELAKVNAQIAFNESQQSSRNEFSSPVQKDRSIMTRAVVAFQNSNIGYRRMLVEGMEDLVRKNGDKRRGAMKVATVAALNAAWYMGLNPALSWKVVSGNADDDDLNKFGEQMLLSVMLGYIANGTLLGPAMTAWTSEHSEYSPIQVFDALKTMVNDVKDKLSKEDYGAMTWAMADYLMKAGGVNLEKFDGMYNGFYNWIERGEFKMDDLWSILNLARTQRREFALNDADVPITEYIDDYMRADKKAAEGDRGRAWLGGAGYNKVMTDKKAKEIVKEYLKRNATEWTPYEEKLGSYSKAIEARYKELTDDPENKRKYAAKKTTRTDEISKTSKMGQLLKQQAIDEILKKEDPELYEIYKRFANVKVEAGKNVRTAPDGQHDETYEARYKRLMEDVQKAAVKYASGEISETQMDIYTGELKQFIELVMKNVVKKKN